MAKLRETESRMVVPRGQGKERMASWYFMGTELSFGMNEVLQVDCGDGRATV